MAMVLDLEAFKKVAEGGEGGAGEGGRGLLGDCEFDAFEGRGLRGLWHAVVLDVGLERVELLDFLLGRGSRSL